MSRLIIIKNYSHRIEYAGIMGYVGTTEQEEIHGSKRTEDRLEAVVWEAT